MCVVLCPKMVQITMCSFVTIRCHGLTLCNYHLLPRGLTPGTPPGNPQEPRVEWYSLVFLVSSQALTESGRKKTLNAKSSACFLPKKVLVGYKKMLTFSAFFNRRALHFSDFHLHFS